MSLINCPDCSKEVSTNAECCLGCGHFFRAFDRTVVVSRKGLETIIAGGVLLAWLVIVAISIFLYFLVYTR